MTPENEEDIYRAQPEPIIPSEERPQFIPPPTPVEPKEEEEPVPVSVPEPEDELADLFEVPQPEDNDMAIDHLLAPPEEVTEDDDVEDLVEVSAEDIMGEPYPGTPPSTETPETPGRVPVKRFKRTLRRYPPPPTSLGGVRY